MNAEDRKILMSRFDTRRDVGSLTSSRNNLSTRLSKAALKLPYKSMCVSLEFAKRTYTNSSNSAGPPSVPKNYQICFDVSCFKLSPGCGTQKRDLKQPELKLFSFNFL